MLKRWRAVAALPLRATAAEAGNEAAEWEID
jgi:hypothetical protein